MDFCKNFIGLCKCLVKMLYWICKNPLWIPKDLLRCSYNHHSMFFKSYSKILYNLLIETFWQDLSWQHFLRLMAWLFQRILSKTIYNTFSIYNTFTQSSTQTHFKNKVSVNTYIHLCSLRCMQVYAKMKAFNEPCLFLLDRSMF